MLELLARMRLSGAAAALMQAPRQCAPVAPPSSPCRPFSSCYCRCCAAPAAAYSHASLLSNEVRQMEKAWKAEMGHW